MTLPSFANEARSLYRIFLLQDGKLFAEGFEAFQVEGMGQDAGFVVWAGCGKAEGIDDGRAAAILTIRVFADAVHAQYITLILDGSGCKQHLPGMHSHRRPRGYADEDIVVVAVPEPKRETQVVANAQMKAQASPLDRYILISRRVMLRLATIGEEVMLVVILDNR